MNVGSITKKVLIILILAAAFLVRFWGVNLDEGRSVFDSDEYFYLHYIAYYFQGHIDPAGIATKFHGLLYPMLPMYLMTISCWLYSGIKQLAFCFAYLMSKNPFPAWGSMTIREFLLVSRVYCVIVGTAVVYVVYRLGRSLLGEREALVAAAFAAFAPQLVNSCRFLLNDVTLTFFMLLSVLFSGYVLTRGEGKWYALAGLMAGLSVGAKTNGISILIVFFLAHGLRVLDRREAKWRFFADSRLFLGLAFIVIGILISYPVVWLEPKAFVKNFPQYLHYLKTFGSSPGSPGEQRVANLFNYLYNAAGQKRGLGLWIFILAAGGVIHGVASRKYRLCLITVFPVIYLAFLILTRPSVRHRDVLTVNTLFCLAAASFLVFAVDFIRGGRWARDAVLFALAGLILSPSWLTDIRVGYAAWAKDTRYLAEEWIRGNIRPGVFIARENGTPSLDPECYRIWKTKHLCYRTPAQYREAKVDYFIASSQGYESYFERWGPQRDKAAQAFYRGLDDRFYLEKIFRVEDEGYISPVIKLYSAKQGGPEWAWKSRILSDLDFCYSDSSSEIVTLGPDLAEKGKGGFWVSGTGPEKRLYISPRKLPWIAVMVFPTRPQSTVKVRVGGEKQTIACGDLQPRLAVFHRPRLNFPFIKYSYGVRAKSLSGDAFLIKFLTFDGEVPESPVAPGGLIERVRAASTVEETGLSTCRAALAGEGFDGGFAEFFRESADWWRRKYTRGFGAKTAGHAIGVKEKDPAAFGDLSVAESSPEQAGGVLIYGPYVNLLPSPWIARFSLKAPEAAGDKTVAVVEVCSDYSSKVFARREIRGSDFPAPGRYFQFDVPFRNEYLGQLLEFRVIYTGEAPLACDRVEVYPDLQAWFRDYLGSR